MIVSKTSLVVLGVFAGVTLLAVISLAVVQKRGSASLTGKTAEPVERPKFLMRESTVSTPTPVCWISAVVPTLTPTITPTITPTTTLTPTLTPTPTTTPILAACLAVEVAKCGTVSRPETCTPLSRLDQLVKDEILQFTVRYSGTIQALKLEIKKNGVSLSPVDGDRQTGIVRYPIPDYGRYDFQLRVQDQAGRWHP